MKNDLHFIGKVLEIGVLQFIHSKNNGKDYYKQELVLEEDGEQYPNSIVVEAFYEDGKPNKIEGIGVDDIIDVMFNTKARSYDTPVTADKPVSRRLLSTTNSIWTCTKQSVNQTYGAATPPPPFQSAAEPIPPVASAKPEGDDLPF